MAEKHLVSVYIGDRQAITYFSYVIPKIGEVLQLNTTEVSGNFEVETVTHFIRERMIGVGQGEELLATYYHPNSTVVVRPV